VSSFEEWSVLEVDAGQRFLRADSFSLGCTLFSVGGMAQGGEWSEQLFLREDSFSPGYTLFSVGGMAQGGEYSRLNNQGQSFLRVYKFSPGCTLISVGGMAEGEEWSKHFLGFIHSVQGEL
jgi:hypothetical protein